MSVSAGAQLLALVKEHPSIAKDVAAACMVVGRAYAVRALPGCDDEFISDMITAQMALAVRSGRVDTKKKSSLPLTEIRARNAYDQLHHAQCDEEEYPSNLTKTYEGVQYGYDPDTNMVIDLNDFSEMGEWRRLEYGEECIDFKGTAQAKHDQYVLENQ